MSLLKKASISDIIGEEASREGYETGWRLVEHYKEFELFLSADDLAEEEMRVRTEKLKAQLDRHNARIRAIHCPPSRFLTSCDDKGGVSTNYLSLREALNDGESFSMLTKLLIFAEAFGTDKEPVIVILHAGSIKGCGSSIPEEYSENETLPKEYEEKVEKLYSLLEDKKINIAVENVTPYYDSHMGENCAGQNSGWGSSFLSDEISLLVGLNKKFQEKPKGFAPFGLCIDFCHLMSDEKYYREKGMPSEFENADTFDKYVERFMSLAKEKFEDKIFLFHLSNLEDATRHGGLFNLDNDCDRGKLNTIKTILRKYPEVPVTLEMKNGDDAGRASAYFDQMMCDLSMMHRDGDKFSEMLNYDDSDTNRNLRKFFDDLFWLYATPASNTETLTRLAYDVKSYVIAHTPADVVRRATEEDTKAREESVLFGFTRDADDRELALLRLQAYIYYTRFCSLGKYLADVYEKANFLSDNKEDFADSMHYFMFCDAKLRQCVYTGVGYAFNVDVLPKRQRLYRFNDGIEDKDVKPFQYQPDKEKEASGEIARRIVNQVNGTPLSLYSLGKNFYPCLCKYCETSSEWSLRIYDDLPINYVRINDKTVSLPKFLYEEMMRCASGDGKPVSVHFRLDVSASRKGRDGIDSFLKGLIKGAEPGLGKETAGNMIDGEVVCTELPQVDDILLSEAEILLLVFCCRNRKEHENVLTAFEFEGDAPEGSVDLSKINKILASLDREQITDGGELKCTRYRRPEPSWNQVAKDYNAPKLTWKKGEGNGRSEQ